MAKVDIPEDITSYFDDESPLGPAAAEHIRDEELAAFLISIENDAFVEVSQGAAVIYGRKGAGKSSVLNGFLFPSKIKSASYLSLDDPSKMRGLDPSSEFRRNFDLIVSVDAAKEISSVASKLERDAVPTDEMAADYWQERLWLNILFATCRRPDIMSRLSVDLAKDISIVASVVGSVKEDDSARAFLTKWSERTSHADMDLGAISIRLKEDLQAKSISVLCLIDSIERYDFVSQPLLRVAVSGLLMFAGRPHRYLDCKIAFPYEAYDTISKEINPEKVVLKSHILRWRAIELVQIVSKRMLLCLYIYEREKIDDIIKEAIRDGRGRAAHFRLWSRVFGSEISNEAHLPEPAIYYVLRHTQMLPRQLILALNNLLSISKTPRNSFMYVNRDVIRDATSASCNTLIGGIDSGFRHTYPDLDRVLDRFLPSCPIVASYQDLHELYKHSSIKKTTGYRSDIYEFVRFLLHIGAFGVIDKSLETDRYIFASYWYHDETVLRLFEGKSFAMHPAFSLMYKDAEDRLNVGKAILPRASLDGLV